MSMGISAVAWAGIAVASATAYSAYSANQNAAKANATQQQAMQQAKGIADQQAQTQTEQINRANAKSPDVGSKQSVFEQKLITRWLMTPEEIITADADERGLDPAPILKSIGHSIDKGESVALHEGDSLLIVRKLDENDAELHLFTSDKPMALVKAIMKFIEKLTQTHVQYFYGNADRDHIIEMLKMLGVKVEDSDKPGYNWKATLQ